VEEKKVTVEDVQKKFGEEIDFDQQVSEKDGFVLDNDNFKKIYKNGINSQEGDYYRLSFGMTPKISDEFEGTGPSNFSGKLGGAGGVRVKLLSDLEEDQVVREIELKSDFEGFQEIVFSANGRYQDLGFEMVPNLTNSEEFDPNHKSEISEGAGGAGPSNLSRKLGGAGGVEVKISDVKLTRLNVQNEYQARNLKPTVFSEIKTSEVTAKSYGYDGQYDNSLNGRGGKIIRWFVPSGKFSTKLRVKLNKIGTGGEGEYKVVVRFRDRLMSDTGKSEILNEKIKFSSDELLMIQGVDGFVDFNFLANFNREGDYSVEIVNEDVLVDKNNYIQLENVFSSGDEVSYFKFSFLDFIASDDSEDQILGNSLVEDMGKYLIYSYQNQGSIVDFVNIFELSSHVDFDEEEKAINGKGEFNNFFTYKFDFEKVFEKVKLEAEVFGGDREEVLIEFSYDNLNWEKFESLADEDGIQKVSQTIANPNRRSKVLYFRVKCNNDKGDHFGLNSFSVKSQLLK